MSPRDRAARLAALRASWALAARVRRVYRDALADVVLALWRPGAEVLSVRTKVRT